jgi:hypothetical protein
MYWDPKMRDSTLLSKQRVEHDLPELSKHTEEVRQAREAQRETGYKGGWSIGWGAVVGWLVFAAVMGGGLLLLLHR